MADPGAGVSFVIPVYNKRAFLPAVIEGVACQRGTFPREFIFIDDGSTDGSREAIGWLTSRWPAARILTQANRGPSVATNRGLAAAQYPFVKLVDADDVLLPDATAALREALLRQPGAVLASGGGEPYASSEEALARLQTAPPIDAASAAAFDALPSFLRNCDLAPSACLIRTESMRRVGGCDERVFTQDYSLFLRLATQGPFLRLAAPVVMSVSAAAGRINDGGPQVLHDANLALFHFLSEHPVPRNLARAAVRRAVKRAWRWAQRREGDARLGRSFRLLLRAYLSFREPPLGLLRDSCAVFAASRAVRRPGG